MGRHPLLEHLEDYWPYVGGLLAVNAIIGMLMRDLTDSGLTLSMMAVDGKDGSRRGKREESRE